MDKISPALRRSNLTDGIGIIRLLLREGHPLGVTQIAEAADAPKSSTFRVLQTLRQLGFVEQQRETNRYTLNPAIFEFVHDLAVHFGKNLSLEKHLRAAAHKLKCSVYLSMLGARDTYVICAAGEEGNTTQLGTHGPAYATSTGKVLVAQLPPDEWPHYAPSPESVAPTYFSNVDPERFYAQLQESRRVGFAWNRRETSKDHVSVAAVVREPFVTRSRLAVALLLRYDLMYAIDIQEMERSIVALAGELEAQLGILRKRTARSHAFAGDSRSLPS